MKNYFAILSCLLLIATGCGRFSTSKVTGIVTLDGKPLKGLHVVFHPKQGPIAIGMIDAEGYYELTTYENGDGAVIGEHRVTINDLDQAGSDNETEFDGDSSEMKLPSKYTHLSSSGLEVVVSAEGENKFDFDLKPWEP